MFLNNLAEWIISMPEEYIIKKEAGYGKRALYSVLWLDSSAEETGCSV